ncbi:MAG: 2-aminoethylphosphonate--pyruvate transaminase [Clostridia bacterium]|jgi:2-aminoethylphosphonate-pyruvate transaminase|nr:2-aminoethylphosphonate--pyruvate transaminase [Clostridia bacterium]
MKGYKLLTPGPLTTTSGVKKEMLFDRCTWDEEYKNITQKIRGQLLEIAAVSPNVYTTVLMQGSGSFGVEAVLMTCISKEEKCLIITNGAYGERMVAMAKCIGTNHVVHRVQYDMIPDANDIKNILESDIGITHIAMVHCETTTGILNPIQDIADISKAYRKTLIVDAMSSFGGIEMNVQDLGIDYLISSANKCIQGVPGFCFVVAKLEKLLKCQGNARCLSLDLYEQWKHMDQDGKWRYTSPTHVVAAFSKALDELAEEGGVFARSKRYESNSRLLRGKLKDIGIVSYIKEAFQSPIITTFRFPREDFEFNTFYHHVKERGFVLYPGKLTDVDTFRIGNIGEIYEQDILQLCDIIKGYVRASIDE